MCGRARQAASPNIVAQAASRDAGVPPNATWKDMSRYVPSENMCPGKTCAVVAQGSQLITMRWGLIPSYDNQGTPDYWKMFNARSETIHTSPVFRRLLLARRCAVPLDGFFEWTADELKQGPKQPWYVYRASGGPLWVAGLYDGPPSAAKLESDSAAPLATFTLITRDVDPKLSWLHDRQPVILDAEGLARWLAPAPTSETAQPPLEALLDGRLSVDKLAWHPTTKKMSRLDYQEADTASAVKLPSQQQKSVASFFGKRTSPGGGRDVTIVKTQTASAPALSDEIACPACTFLQRRAPVCEICGSALISHEEGAVKKPKTDSVAMDRRNCEVKAEATLSSPVHAAASVSSGVGPGMPGRATSPRQHGTAKGKAKAKPDPTDVKHGQGQGKGGMLQFLKRPGAPS